MSQCFGFKPLRISFYRMKITLTTLDRDQILRHVLLVARCPKMGCSLIPSTSVGAWQIWLTSAFHGRRIRGVWKGEMIVTVSECTGQWECGDIGQHLVTRAGMTAPLSNSSDSETCFWVSLGGLLGRPALFGAGCCEQIVQGPRRRWQWWVSGAGAL